MTDRSFSLEDIVYYRGSNYRGLDSDNWMLTAEDEAMLRQGYHEGSPLDLDVPLLTSK
jgi:hypothetical protein